MIHITNQQVNAQAQEVAETILEHVGAPVRIYAVPRGGVPAAYAVLRWLPNSAHMVSSPEQANVIVDDLIDSGATMQRYAGHKIPFCALFDKRVQYKGEWLVFPWEENDNAGPHDAVVRLLQFIGEDPKREGLLETPSRVVDAWKHEWFDGYNVEPADVLKTFVDGADGVDEMVVVRDIPLYSHCEHHIAPFFGVAHVAYIPESGIVGLSKLARLVDVFAARLQVQERLTNQIVDALVEHVKPLGAGVILQCRHLCMESRGIRRPGAVTVTSAVRGALREKGEARSEFLALARHRDV